jgi:hypothetical protein
VRSRFSVVVPGPGCWVEQPIHPSVHTRQRVHALMNERSIRRLDSRAPPSRVVALTHAERAELTALSRVGTGHDPDPASALERSRPTGFRATATSTSTAAGASATWD